VRGRTDTMRTVVVLAVPSGLFALAGLWLGGQPGLVIAVVLAVAASTTLYFSSEGLVLRSAQARPVTEVDQPLLYRTVCDLARAARQPMPRLYLAPTHAATVFATGRNPRNAAVCVTAGILTLLPERELRAVLGHELAHIYHRDIRASTVAAALASVILWPAQATWMLPPRRGDTSHGTEDRHRIGGLFALLLGPLAAAALRLTAGRARELRGDAAGAELTTDPLALASALRRMEDGTRRQPLRAQPRLRATSALMIANPFRACGGTGFATHPPLAERIARLEALAGHDH